MELTEGFRGAPGCCAVCATVSTSTPVVDLQVYDQGFIRRAHRIYLCGECAIQVGTMVAPALGKAVVDAGIAAELEALRATVRAETGRADRAEAVIADMRAFLPDVVTS